MRYDLVQVSVWGVRFQLAISLSSTGSPGIAGSGTRLFQHEWLHSEQESLKLPASPNSNEPLAGGQFTRQKDSFTPLCSIHLFDRHLSSIYQLPQTLHQGLGGTRMSKSRPIPCRWDRPIINRITDSECHKSYICSNVLTGHGQAQQEVNNPGEVAGCDISAEPWEWREHAWKTRGIKYSCQRNTLNKTRRYKTGHHMRKERVNLLWWESGSTRADRGGETRENNLKDRLWLLWGPCQGIWFIQQALGYSRARSFSLYFGKIPLIQT